VVGRDELLLAGEDELHGPPRRTGQRCDVPLEVEVALRPEAASEQRDDDAYVGFRDLQNMSDAASRRVRNLGRAPDRDSITLPLGENCTRLDRHTLRRIGHVPALDDDLGSGHDCVGVALDHRREAEQVSASPELLVALVRLPFFVDEGRALGDCVLRIAHRLQRFVLDVDHSRGLGSDLGRQRRDGGDDVTLEADSVAREEATVLHQLAVEDIRDVLVCQHGEDARHCESPRRVDRDDPSVRMVGVAELRVELSGQVQVGCVAPGAGDLLLAVGSDEGLAFRSCFDGGHLRPENNPWGRVSQRRTSAPTARLPRYELSMSSTR
jgi:hypothetical protein